MIPHAQCHPSAVSHRGASSSTNTVSRGHQAQHQTLMGRGIGPAGHRHRHRKTRPSGTKQERNAEELHITPPSERRPDDREQLKTQHQQTGPLPPIPVTSPAGGNSQCRAAQQRQCHKYTLLGRGQPEFLSDRHGQGPEQQPHHETHGEMQPGAGQGRPMPAAQGYPQRAEAHQRLHSAPAVSMPSVWFFSIIHALYEARFQRRKGAADEPAYHVVAWHPTSGIVSPCSEFMMSVLADSPQFQPL